MSENVFWFYRSDDGRELRKCMIDCKNKDEENCFGCKQHESTTTFEDINHYSYIPISDKEMDKLSIVTSSMIYREH
jgi:hypothetical protein